MKTLVLLALVGFVAAQIQVQIPIQRPQQPQQPPQHQFPQFPSFPQQPPQPPQRQPINPRQTWRDGVFDSRCPVVDDVTGWAVLLDSTVSNQFFICWNRLAFPFTCPDRTVYWHAERTCAFPEQIEASRFPNRPIRPFNEDGEDNE